MATKPQINYNNKHASTPQASKQKKESQMKTMYNGIYRSRKHTHKKNNTTKNTYTEEHTYIKNIHSNDNTEKIYTIEMKHHC